eukprot:Amastigsp_a342563_5.p3 type:complete len:169 gc:universal Amastigsp_a342563_5:179-685(+)
MPADSMTPQRTRRLRAKARAPSARLYTGWKYGAIQAWSAPPPPTSSSSAPTRSDRCCAMNSVTATRLSRRPISASGVAHRADRNSRYSDPYLSATLRSVYSRRRLRSSRHAMRPGMPTTYSASPRAASGSSPSHCGPKHSTARSALRKRRRPTRVHANSASVERHSGR